MADDLQRQILKWFVEKDQHGSQTSGLERALTRAADEIVPALKADREAVLNELEKLRGGGFIETVQGEGMYRGAYVTRIAMRGREFLYPPAAPAPAIHQTIHATNIGVVGTMSGGSISQNAGSSVAELITALEALKKVAEASDAPQAGIVALAADQSINELKSEEPDEGEIQKYLVGVGEVIRTLGEFGEAWALVSAAAAPFGIHLPPPPGH